MVIRARDGQKEEIGVRIRSRICGSATWAGSARGRSSFHRSDSPGVRRNCTERCQRSPPRVHRCRCVLEDCGIKRRRASNAAAIGRAMATIVKAVAVVRKLEEAAKPVTVRAPAGDGAGSRAGRARDMRAPHPQHEQLAGAASSHRNCGYGKRIIDHPLGSSAGLATFGYCRSSLRGRHPIELAARRPSAGRRDNP